uniref:Uncharacterized protein n=1 Tax=Arion vulgaris TaxID=1028688 RepID=A0A0B6YFL0_9EUPU
MQKNYFRPAGTGCSVMLMFVIYLVKGTWGVCPGNPNRSVRYVVIPEADYDRNYSSIATDGKQPLGFHKAIWHYNQDDTPCINITGVSTRRLEIMFETFPSSRLCVKVQNSQQECSDPGTGRHYVCKQSPADTVYLEFTCDSQCSENDVQFWYRIVPGVKADEDPEDHWCYDRNMDEYPENLKPFPSGIPYNPPDTTPGGADSRSASHIFLVIMIFSVRFL